ncbi:LSU ribosomal protein L7AE [Desulforamulus reducens MI-1]|uniref:LSU ribosomal protein L7AE n=1 Tax=Desulforamulus reducens (strain ATCC BAA-1160 / DSM 100696 / MI-1) TaxID=349161 RepID=A4J5X3_DESRM|nr:L7Ae/L30e/S12e/Gadd45 family ribosomal protein [Desulforamulus reducens]ABO50476.1 LSU ribosomal protein L7AE [Desulforamulus reducens MI-1]
MSGSVFHLLGLSQRAGKTVSGDFAVRENIIKGKVKLLIIAADTSERIKQEYIRIGQSKKVTTKIAFTKHELGSALGKSPRAAVAIMDPNFARGIESLLEGGEA